MKEGNEENWERGVREGKTPDIVKEEPDDKPAARNLRWTIIIAIVILAIIYFVFFYTPESI